MAGRDGGGAEKGSARVDGAQSDLHGADGCDSRHRLAPRFRSGVTGDGFWGGGGFRSPDLKRRFLKRRFQVRF